ncbi:hypothetical protein DE146DRAFT_204226 [Phaeosphaeria sp. MPI-PUGE-AT-0046c]|nr:hypothetical protein DE146DRAFT_204226 [Phaeosphaeria sp. MPI-PUGE-AT-0046c]
MSSDPKQLILIVLPVVALSLALIVTAIAIIVKMRRRAQLQILPTAQKSVQPPSFTEAHLANLREWQKPANSASMNDSSSTIKTDPGHLPFLAQPCATLQKPQKGSWELFKEKQQQRALNKENAQPVSAWHHKPKGPGYWREVGKQMEARKTWWEKVRDRAGF